jgi:hypothetical protein
VTQAKQNRAETDAASRQPPPEQDRPLVKPQRALSIKGLIPSLPERGKIKIGSKGAVMKSNRGNEFQPPQKLDHFVVTTLDRGQDGNFKRDEAIHEALGEKPTEIPVRLLYDDPTLNFITRYACFAGRTLWCAGDGETAQRVGPDNKGHVTVACPCHRQDPAYEGTDKCKMNGSLSVLIEGAGGIGGVWKFRTTSYNSVVGIMSTLAFLRSVTGGPLSNIPLLMTVRPKQVTDPRGRQQTVFVVGLEFSGDIGALQQIGHQIALDRAKTHMSITYIEDEARRLLLAPPENVPIQGDDAEDIVAEFYPEQAEAAAAGAPRAPTREAIADQIHSDHVIEQDLDRGSDRMPDTAEERGEAPEASDQPSECGPQDQGNLLEDRVMFHWSLDNKGASIQCVTAAAWVQCAIDVLGKRFEVGKPLKPAWDFNFAQWQLVQKALAAEPNGQASIDLMHIKLDELLTAEKDRKH